MGSYVVYGLPIDSPPMLPARSPNRTPFALWEIFLALISALIATCYALRHETAHSDDEIIRNGLESIPYLADIARVLDPGPGILLGACLIFGCSISSYSYRRQDLDKYQTAFFVVIVLASCTIGAVLGANPNIIMLGYVPWGVCIAIVTSAVSHWIMRQCGIKTGNVHREVEDNKGTW